MPVTSALEFKCYNMLRFPASSMYVATIAALLVQALCVGTLTAEDAIRPNIVVIFTDDQGYGDLSCYGAQNFQTPRLDALAEQGTRFTNFYAQVVCGPSRSALLTGRYPNRSLGWSMPSSEITVAELLREQGYATACIGKWDVSNRAAIEDRVPNAQGFDYYFGTLGANDNGRVVLHENQQQIDETDNMAGLTRLYTDKSIDFLKQNQQRPFLLYLAHTMVHSVIDVSPEFKGTSNGGLYGDVIQELDHHCGRLLDTLDELGLRDNTLVIFTSDNGPWNNLRDVLEKKHHGQVAWGSSGPLREGKGSTYEGGLRVPCLVRWPGKVPAGHVSDAMFATIDFLPTFAALGGCNVPDDRVIDGVDQSDMLLGKNDASARNDYFYFCKNELHAVRKGNYKLMLADRRQHYNYVKDKGSDDVELYDLAADIGERRNLAAEKPEIVRELLLHATSISMPDARPDDRIALAADRKRTINELKSGDWIAHHFDAAGRDQIDQAFEDGIQRGIVPGGALLMIHKGEVVHRKAYGLADLESKQPFTIETPCRIASLTKPHTATLLSILADQGKLNLSDPIDVYLPEFKSLRVQGTPVRRAPTLLECLSHTAGFPGNSSFKRTESQVAGFETLGQAVERLAQEDLVTAPGTKYDYSRCGFMVAGRVAEVVTGRTIQDLMRRYLLAPIGAEVATLIPDEETRLRIPTQYDRVRGNLVERRREDMVRSINPGGSMVSTVDDVARLMLLHRDGGRVGNRQIVSGDALRQMIVAQPATSGTGYGLGFNIMSKRPDGTAKRIRHTGASGTFAMLDFEDDLIVIIFTQVEQNKIMLWRNQLLQTIDRACRIP